MLLVQRISRLIEQAEAWTGRTRDWNAMALLSDLVRVVKLLQGGLDFLSDVAVTHDLLLQ